MIDNKCIICGVIFPSKQISKYCSPKCYRNSDKNKEYMKKFVENNKDRRNELNKINREKNKEYMKEYHIINKERIKECNVKYYQNPENVNKQKIRMNNFHNKKYKEDIIYKLRAKIRSRIWSALKNNSKQSSSLKLLGTSILEYKQYLEAQFTPEMNWGNHGLYWEIDHIKPLNTFDLFKKENQMIAFNYKNTRPLEKIYNRCRPKNGSDL